ncbi:MAG: NADPH:quinone oxidoreductase family protein [Hyphomicrobium sp.]
MKAALCKSLDGPAGLEIVDVPAPEAGPGEILLRVAAVGLNFADTLLTRGKYQFKPDLPFSPGAEVAGRVVAIGPGAAGFDVGARAMAYVNWGGAREVVTVTSTAATSIPDAVSDLAAAGVSVVYGTAMHGLLERGRLQRGETAVVTGAAGGAGQAAVEIAKASGARVIAVVSSADKAAIATACGADATTLASGAELKDAIKTLTGGRGADVVYDCIGGDASEALIRSLAWGGRFLVVGFASGDIPRIPLNLLMLKGAEAAGVFWGESVRRDPARHAHAMRQVLDWIASGRLKPQPPTIFPLADIAKALAILERRESKGKIVVTI